MDASQFPGGLNFLTDEQVALLQRTIDRVRKMSLGPQSSGGTPPEEPRSQDVYFGLTPASGIPPLSAAVGTGSSPDGSGDQPGSAPCSVYRINSSGVMEALASGLSIYAYNLSAARLPGYSWVILIREKTTGLWAAIPLAPSVLVGKVASAVLQGGMGNVAIYTSISGSVSSTTDLSRTNIDVSAFFLLGAGLQGAWVILLPWAFGYLAVNMECNPIGTGT